MGSLKGKPSQGILIDGHKYKDGANVYRKSKVDMNVPDGSPTKGVKLGVRIASNQTVIECKLDGVEIQGLPRDPTGESELEKNDPAGGESWCVWSVPRDLLPKNLRNFKTTFRLTPPTAIQTVKWAVCYAHQSFTGGYVIFGFADVGYKGAETGGATTKRRRSSR